MIAEFISPETLGFILIAVMLFAIFIGFPISFTLIFLGFVFGYLGFGKLVFYLMTLIPLKDSWLNVDRFDSICCTKVLRSCMALLSRYMRKDNMGSGKSVYRVNLGATLTI